VKTAAFLMLLCQAAPATAVEACKPSAVNLNTARTAELARLPGIGESTAAKIVKARPFSQSYDLVKRRIVTTATYQQIRDKVCAQ